VGGAVTEYIFICHVPPHFSEDPMHWKEQSEESALVETVGRVEAHWSQPCK